GSAPLTRLEGPPSSDKALAALPRAQATGELAASGSAPLSRLDGSTGTSRAIATLPRAEATGELAAAGAAPLARIDAPPAPDRALASLPKAETPRALAAAEAPLRRLDAPPSSGRTLTPIKIPEPTGKPALIGTPLRPLDLAADDCIDDQKRRARQNNVSYAPMEDVVRQYCYCMAPFLADVATTATVRVKLLNDDPALKARAGTLDKVCLDGVRSGRRFAP
ncbi:MAG: hypothetical protein ABI886_15305, partial [Betaproteobacteria bacterium]